MPRVTCSGDYAVRARVFSLALHDVRRLGPWEAGAEAGPWEAGDPSLATGSEIRDWLMISLWGKDKANSSSKRDVPFTQFLCLDQVAGAEARAGGSGVCVDGPGEGQGVSSRP